MAKFDPVMIEHVRCFINNEITIIWAPTVQNNLILLHGEIIISNIHVVQKKGIFSFNIWLHARLHL
jgi:hypothetical protein